MYSIPENTVFVGKNLIYIPKCSSTNPIAADLGQKDGTAEGTVVVTDEQTAGRGQRGNLWESQPGKNLTFSLILKPGFIPVKDQFELNMAISLGITDYITRKVSEKVRIKWPNDILVDGRKVGGILIENHVSRDEIAYSVIGIGLNVNQHKFSYPHAASLKVFTGMEYELGNELCELLAFLEVRYLELRHGNPMNIAKKYLELLFGMGEVRRFMAGDQVFEGTITGIDQSGRLLIVTGGQGRSFGVKEIGFL